MPSYSQSSKNRAKILLELRRRKRLKEKGVWYKDQARPEQLPPADDDWSIWLLLAGRGFGKTRTIVEWGNEQALKYPGSRGSIVAATNSDVRDVLVYGESGFLNIENPPAFKRRRLEWPNGSVGLLYSAQKPARLRGPQSHWAIADELAYWQYPETWDMLLFGLRLGDHPRVAVATTPRPTKEIKQLIKDPTCRVVKGTTYDNRANLATTFFTQIVKKYEGTRLGRQELNAELLEDSPGALWTLSTIDDTRVMSAPELDRIVVSIDPSATGNENSDEAGIIVAGRAGDHFFVLEDLSKVCKPIEWAKRAVGAYHLWKADRLVAEVNNGGDMVEVTVRVVDPNVSYQKVHASRGKKARAEPVSALYEQKRVHHVGIHAPLEDEMTTWDPEVSTESPNRVDALVWAITALMVRKNQEPATSMKG